jgi:hypothetical protein
MRRTDAREGDPSSPSKHHNRAKPAKRASTFSVGKQKRFILRRNAYGFRHTAIQFIRHTAMPYNSSAVRSCCANPPYGRKVRLFDIRSPFAIALENADLTSRQRRLKSSSPSGSVQMQCRWSGKTATASSWNGCACLTVRNASRKVSICSVSSLRFRSARLTVKKYVPPLTLQRR